MKNFQQLKQGTEVDIDGMLVNEKEKNIFNFKKVSTLTYRFFCIRFIYNCLFECNTTEFGKKSFDDHFIIINNTTDHIERLEVDFDEKGIKQFCFLPDFSFKVSIEFNFF